MDIKKITSHITDSKPAGKSQHTAGSGPITNQSISDKVSLNGYHFRQNEILFARSEYDKQNIAAFEKIKIFKSQLTEYDQIKEVTDVSSHNTELGKKLNDPEIWNQIARKILG